MANNLRRLFPLVSLLDAIGAVSLVLCTSRPVPAQPPPEIPIRLRSGPRYLSSDGKLLIGSGFEGNEPQPWVRVWDSLTGRLLKDWSGGPRYPALAPDSSVLYQTERGDLEIFDLKTGKDVSWKSVQESELSGAAFSKDGKLVATAGSDNRIILWDLKDKAAIQKFNVPTGQIAQLCFSPDSYLLAVARNDNTIWVWNLQTHKSLPEFASTGLMVRHLAFSPDSKLLVTVAAGEVFLWDLVAGKLRLTLKHHYDVQYLTFSPDGKLLVTANQGDAETGSLTELRFWEVATGKELKSFKPDMFSVHGIDISRDGRKLFVFGSDLRIYDMKAMLDWNPPTPRRILAGNSNEIDSLQYSPDGQKLAFIDVEKKAARVWDAQFGKQLFVTPMSTIPIEHPCFSPDSRHLVTISKKDNGPPAEIKLWDALTGQERWALQTETWDLAPLFTPDGHFLIFSNRTHVILVNVVTGTETKRAEVSATRVIKLAVSKNGKTLFTAGLLETPPTRENWHKYQYGYEIKLWELPTLRQISGWNRKPDSQYPPQFQIDPEINGLLETETEGRSVFYRTVGAILRNLDSGKDRLKLDLSRNLPGIVQFVPVKRSVFALADSYSIRLWNASTGEIHVLVEMPSSSDRLSCSPDGIFLATKYSNVVPIHGDWKERDSFTNLWDSATGQKLAVLQDASLRTFSPDSKTLVTIDLKGQVMLWDIDTLVRNGERKARSK